jgi:hypothetical protein
MSTDTPTTYLKVFQQHGTLLEQNEKQFRIGIPGVLEYLKSAVLSKAFLKHALEDLAIYKIAYLEAAVSGGWLKKYNLEPLLERYNIDYNLFVNGEKQEKENNQNYQTFANDRDEWAWVFWLFRERIKCVSYDDGEEQLYRRYPNHSNRFDSTALYAVYKPLGLDSRSTERRVVALPYEEKHKVAVAYANRFQPMRDLTFRVYTKLQAPFLSAWSALIKDHGNWTTFLVKKNTGRQTYEFHESDPDGSYQKSLKERFVDVCIEDLIVQFKRPEKFLQVYNVLKDFVEGKFFLTVSGADYTYDYYTNSRSTRGITKGVGNLYYSKEKMAELIKVFKEKEEQYAKASDPKADNKNTFKPSSECVEWSE